MLACKNEEKSNWETFLLLDVSVNIFASFCQVCCQSIRMETRTLLA
jgi:hypothetical protein